MKNNNKKLVAVTMGDPSGISTEIIIKSWKKTAHDFFVIHDPDYILKVANKLKLKVKIKVISNPEDAHGAFKKYLPVLPIEIDKSTKLGKPNYNNSKNIFHSIDLAVKLAKKKRVSGIVTSPISKEILSKFKKNFTGHTEYFNGHKSDSEAFDWYRRQRFYDPRRAMAIRAWIDGDLRLALRLLQWAQPLDESSSATDQDDSNLSYQAA